MAPSNNVAVRLGIVGAGTIGTFHGLASLDAPEATVTAVTSRTASRASALAERLGNGHSGRVPRVYQTLDDLCAAPDVDAIVICTPTPLHAEQTVAALRAGKHVIVEKPIARDLASAEAMIAAAQACDRQLHVAHVVRFFPEFLALREAIFEGSIGQPALARMSRVAAFPHGSDEWHNALAWSGGALFDMGIHDIDWLLWTFGRAVRVHARGLYNRGLPFLDYALATIRLESGVIAHIESSWAEAEGFAVKGEISGDAGLLAYDSADSEAVSISLRQPIKEPPGVVVPSTHTAESPYVIQLRHYCRCIQGTEAPIVRPEEALEALRVVLACLESIDRQQPVAL